MQKIMFYLKNLELKGKLTNIRGCKMYKIIRMYFPELFQNSEVIKTGLTLKEAQEHCRREDTREEGVFFDGYEEE